MATLLLNLIKQQYGPHPLGKPDSREALVGLFMKSPHGRRLFNRVLGDVSESPRFKRAQRKSLQGVFTAEEAVRLVVD